MVQTEEMTELKSNNDEEIIFFTKFLCSIPRTRFFTLEVYTLKDFKVT
jgi:hypothetical protein